MSSSSNHGNATKARRHRNKPSSGVCSSRNNRRVTSPPSSFAMKTPILLRPESATAPSLPVSPPPPPRLNSKSKSVKPSKRMKLITKGMDFGGETLAPILHSNSDQLSDFRVIGSIGAEGVGKSTVMNILNSQAVEGKVNPVFPVQSFDDLINGKHRTSGIDCWVSMEDQFILLDCQPLWGLNVVQELMNQQRESSSASSSQYHASTRNLAQYIDKMDIQSLQLAVFLFHICDVLLVIDDQIEAHAISASWQRMYQIQHFSEYFGNPWSKCHAQVQNRPPTLVFVMNKIPLSQFRSHSILHGHQKDMSFFSQDQGDTGALISQVVYLPNLDSCAHVSRDDRQVYLNDFRDLCVATMVKSTKFRTLSSPEDWLQACQSLFCSIQTNSVFREYRRVQSTTTQPLDSRLNV